jgi:3-phenylpropionate/trans-cinnamate dioxygenase ferredoxin subunit
MSDVTITATENGPYRVDGDIELRDQDGHPSDTAGTPIFLCRCGASARKPFCDGSHARIGFRAAGEPAAGRVPSPRGRELHLSVGNG